MDIHEAPLQQLPDELAQQLPEVLRHRPRTVWDARRLLQRFKQEIIPVVFDDGQDVRATQYGRFEDVVHTPTTGFSLVLRGLMFARDPEIRQGREGQQEQTTLPLSLIRELPEEFAFLFEPPDQWPMPDHFAPCPNCDFQLNTGRFCTQCGEVVRRGWQARFPGEGFASMQEALRRLHEHTPRQAVQGDCGGRQHQSQQFCGKCGRNHREG